MRDVLNRFAVAWLLAFGISYIATAIFAPGVAGDPVQGMIVYTLLGVAILAAVALRTFTESQEVSVPLKPGVKMRIEVEGPRRNLGRVLLAVLGVIEVIGCVTSWTGVGVWNVPFPNKEVFQVSMALMDMVSAVFMFCLASAVPEEK